MCCTMVFMVAHLPLPAEPQRKAHDVQHNGIPRNDNINDAIKQIPPTVTFPSGRRWHLFQVAGKRNTKEQKYFLTWLRWWGTGACAVIDAKAGSGKTTTMCNGYVEVSRRRARSCSACPVVAVSASGGIPVALGRSLGLLRHPS